MSTPTDPAVEPDVAIETPSSGPAMAAVGGETLGDYYRRWRADVRSGELGSLPIVLALILIAIIFQSQNDRFLTASNFVNLIVQSAAYMCIGMGIVFVLLLGEIDLSIGFVSGVAGVIAALLTFPDGNQMSVVLALIIALGAGTAIGVLQGLFIARVGVPSFVVTLAGLLGWNGVVLLLIGDRGTVIIQDNFLIGFANDFLPDATAWILAIVATAIYAGVLLYQRQQRLRGGLPTPPMSLVALRIGALAIALLAVVYVANKDRGVPYVLLALAGLFMLWTYVLNRTRFGRYVYAVGGNAEAARRAGINVARIRIACFALCSLMAAIGGIILASRLRSVDTNSGGGAVLLYSIAAAVIGGTSLFGGRGHMRSAILGALVILSIDNGLGLLGKSAGTRFVITGLVLLAAATVDSLSRRGRESAGRA